MGLSVKWTSCNLGASKTEEYGGYYQWGGLVDVTNTSINLDLTIVLSRPARTIIPVGRNTYLQICPHIGPIQGDPDNKTILDPEDDAAHFKLDNKWRIPTKEEFKELYNNCTSEHTTLNGVLGRKFTSKKNGNSIFLPVAGCRYFNILGSVNSYGMYWTLSLYSAAPYCAYSLLFCSDDVRTFQTSRWYGLSIRPVCD